MFVQQLIIIAVRVLVFVITMLFEAIFERLVPVATKMIWIILRGVLKLVFLVVVGSIMTIIGKKVIDQVDGRIEVSEF